MVKSGLRNLTNYQFLGVTSMPIVIFFICTALLMFPIQAHAYLGPGLGLGAIGVVFGILFSVLLGLLGLFWYPLKRLFGKIPKKA